MQAEGRGTPPGPGDRPPRFTASRTSGRGQGVHGRRGRDREAAGVPWRARSGNPRCCCGSTLRSCCDSQSAPWRHRCCSTSRHGAPGGDPEPHEANARGVGCPTQVSGEARKARHPHASTPASSVSVTRDTSGPRHAGQDRVTKRSRYPLVCPARAAETHEAVAVRRFEPEAIRRAHPGGIVVEPRAATEHPAVAARRPRRISHRSAPIRSVPIAHPLPHVPRHVLQPKRASARRM